jgi:hypothetical protein
MCEVVMTATIISTIHWDETSYNLAELRRRVRPPSSGQENNTVLPSTIERG